MHKNTAKLWLKKNLTYKECSLAVDTALFLGFNSTSTIFPITSYNKGVIPAENLTSLSSIFTLENSLTPSEYVSSTKSAVEIPEFQKNNLGIEGFFSIGDFFKDLDNDALADKLNFKILIPENFSDEIVESVCNLAFRIGMETTTCESGILAHAGYEGNSVIFKDSNKCEVFLEEKNGHKNIFICGNGKQLVDFVVKLCNNFPKLSYGFTWENALEEIRNSMILRNLDGQIAFAKSIYDVEGGCLEAFCEPSCENISEKIRTIMPGVDFINYKGLKEAYTDEYYIPWEKEVFEEILENDIYPKLKAGDRVEVFGSLSEDEKVRKDVLSSLQNSILKKDAVLEKSRITCAYKQGFSWIEEYVIPIIEKLQVQKIKIYFKAFLPEGVSEWIDEDGATPSYSNIGGDNPDKWYDLPIRFLQELYPIDDFIANKLGISTDNIIFEEYKGEEDISYLIKAYDSNESELYSDEYKVYVNERPFLDDYKNMGKVHPATGYIKVYINNELICDKIVKTDIENIWDKFNGDVLSKCKKHVLEKFDENISYENQPFFSRLKLEVFVSEPERKLPSRQDIISPLDALHEDMYFVATDYFKNFGMEKCNSAFDAPGLILPVLHVREGKPSFKVTLYDRVKDEPSVTTVKSDYALRLNKKDISIKIKNIAYENDKIIVTIKLDGADENTVKAYSSLLSANVLHINTMLDSVDQIILETSQNSYVSEVLKPVKSPKNISIDSIDIMEREIIGYEDYIRIMEQLKFVEGIEVYEAGRSYGGRIIYAVDLLPKNEIGYISRVKRLSAYPSELINCRHHANEVSSTNACFMILRELLTNEKYANLGDKLNLTFVPVENTDGTAIHYELCSEYPTWKFHVARFNALSKEFFHEVFNPETIHTEALVFRKLYEEKLPDIVVDNHGVPSHEWEQQYSGYTSPSFKGFWLPRSILYGYFWTVPQKEFESNLILSKRIEHEVAAAIGQNKEMTDLNIEMGNRFEKYAHNWMPKLFPANYYMNMINYWIWQDFSLSNRYVSHKHPWITTTYYTSEVADETAQGDYLTLCAKAHFTHNMAILDIMHTCDVVIESENIVQAEKVSLSYVRQRPVLVKQ